MVGGSVMDLQRNVLQSWLNEDLVITGMEADCWEEALKILSGRLKEKGYVKDDFYRALVEREKSFPTGLPVEGDIKAAIPHANPDYVIKPAVAVGVLKTRWLSEKWAQATGKSSAN
jgi:PTS system galactitol-specific IIA component